MWILILAGSMLLGLIPASIAKEKGYDNYGLWWLYGWLLFIIAIIHVACLPSKNVSSSSNSGVGNSTNEPETNSVGNNDLSLQNNNSSDSSKSTNNQLELVFEEEPNSIQANIPVLIEKVSLFKDRSRGDLKARCFFRSVTSKPISALLVDVLCFDVWGNESGVVSDFQYLDLSTKRESIFGQTEPIPIENLNTRNIKIKIKKVLYSDGSRDETTDDQLIYKKEELKEFFNNIDLVNEYVREVGQASKFVPVVGEFFWRCTCGIINNRFEHNCYKCRINQDIQVSHLDRELISSNLAIYQEAERKRIEKENAEKEEQKRIAEEKERLEREEKERQEKEEAERKAEDARLKKEKIKKITKRIVLTVISILFASFLVYAIGWHVIPYSRYTKACKLQNNQLFDEAYSIFTALGDFSDSPEKAKETLYKKGEYLISTGAYYEAAEVFRLIADYQDGQSQMTYCLNEGAYRDALALMDSGQYKDAAAAFKALNNYLDSNDKYQFSQYMYAKGLFDDGDYASAHRVFADLGTYNDSLDMSNESEYLLSLEYYENGEYNLAYTGFSSIVNYKDSRDRAIDSQYHYGLECYENEDYKNAYDAFNSISMRSVMEENEEFLGLFAESKYQYALILMDQHNWLDASNLLKDLGNYKDSASQYKEAYYQYGISTLDDKRYVTAVEIFESLGNYQDSKEKSKEAKYGYVLAHYNNNDTTTYGFLKSLKDAGYKDCRDLYTKLYSWHVSFVMNSDPDNYTSNLSSVSRYGDYVCHITLTGGTPGEEIYLKYTMVFPDGGRLYDYWDFKMGDGDRATCWGYYEDKSNIPTGTFTVKIYIKSTGEYLGEASIKIT